MRINAGQLDRKIEVWQEVEGAKNQFQETEKTPTVLLATFAKRMEPTNSGDRETMTDNMQILTSNQVQFLIRWTPEKITPKMWVMCDGVKFGINQHPTEVGRNQYLIITTERKDNV
jgi:head-tail adaptor